MKVPLSAAAGIASLSAFEILRLYHSVSSSDMLWVEWLSFAGLALWCQVSRYREAERPSAPLDQEPQSYFTDIRPSIRLDALLGLVLVSAQYVYDSASGDLSWTLPLLTVLTFCSSLLFNQPKEPGDNDAAWLQSWRIGARNRRAFVVFVVISLMCCSLLFWNTVPSRSPLNGLLFTVLQSVIYVLPVYLKSTSKEMESTPRDADVPSVSTGAFASCSFVFILLRPGLPGLGPLVVALSGLRSLQWYLILDLIRSDAALTATTIMTAGTIAAQSLYWALPTSGLATTIVASTAIVQAVTSIPASEHDRKWLLIFLIFTGLALIHSLAGTVQPRATAYFSRNAHPIETLVHNAEVKVADMIEKQSTTVEEAVVQYTRRYRRRPPPGFDIWFEIAQERDFFLIDEFDTVMESIEPFWGVPPNQLRARVLSALDSEHLINFNIRGHELKWSKDNWAPWLAQQIEFALREPLWRQLLPDMTFALSDLDEPRVVVPFGEVAVATQAAKSGRPSFSRRGIYRRADVSFGNVGRQDAWKFMESSCPSGFSARGTSNAEEAKLSSGIHFVTNLTDEQDICTHPELHNMHGFISHPDSLSLTHSLVPIFSQAKPSIFNDLLYPSPFYTGKMDQQEYKEEEDPDWNKKADQLYWTGATTGGFATAGNWMNLHRQRLALKLASEDPATLLRLNQTSSNQWIPYTNTWSSISGMFDVRLTGIAQCEPEACDAERDAFGIKPFEEGKANPNRDPLRASYGSKYVLDLDGNAFSGRFYRMLKSKCAVLKQTIFKEWHDGRLVPWIHFVPVSFEADELGEIMRFLTQEKAGRKIGKKIAEEGRNWARLTLKRRDVEVAFLRILMEYGRVMSDNRDNMYYKKDG